MNSRDAALRRYYRRIKSWLPCSRQQKKEILEKIKSNVSDYLEENPEADFRQVQAWFGAPESIAAAYVDEMDTTALLSGLRIRRKILAMVAGLAALIVISWGMVVVGSFIHQAKAFPGVIEVEIVDVSELSEDERNQLGLE